MDKNTKAILETLEFIKERMVTKDELAEQLDDIRSTMATKVDLAAFRHEFAQFRAETAENFHSIRDELRDIKRRLTDLEKLAENQKGLTKEIDHALARIAAIEKHLGLNNRISA